MKKYKYLILTIASIVLVFMGFLIVFSNFKIDLFYFSIILICIFAVVYTLNKK